MKSEEETYVRDDQQSMEEDGIMRLILEEDTPTEISTGGSFTLKYIPPPILLTDWSRVGRGLGDISL